MHLQKAAAGFRHGHGSMAFGMAVAPGFRHGRGCWLSAWLRPMQSLQRKPVDRAPSHLLYLSLQLLKINEQVLLKIFLKVIQTQIERHVTKYPVTLFQNCQYHENEEIRET